MSRISILPPTSLIGVSVFVVMHSVVDGGVLEQCSGRMAYRHYTPGIVRVQGKVCSFSALQLGQQFLHRRL